jgi:hypothetical protein
MFVSSFNYLDIPGIGAASPTAEKPTISKPKNGVKRMVNCQISAMSYSRQELNEQIV